jgi:hypothetical protein
MVEFPEQKVVDFLNGWYHQQISSALRTPKTPEQLLKEGGNVFDIQPELSSTNAVPVLLRLTDLLGFEPTKSVIKRGGYRSKQEFVQDMTAKLKASFISKQKPKLRTTPAKEATANANV